MCCSCSQMEAWLPWSSSAVHGLFYPARREVWWDTPSPLTARWRKSLWLALTWAVSVCGSKGDNWASSGYCLEVFLFVWSSYSLLSSMCHIQDLIFLILWSKVTLLFWAMFLTLVFIFSFSCLHALVCCCLQERPQMWVGMQASMSMCLRLPQLESPCKHLSWTSTLWLQAEDRDCFSGKFAQIV